MDHNNKAYKCILKDSLFFSCFIIWLSLVHFSCDVVQHLIDLFDFVTVTSLLDGEGGFGNIVSSEAYFHGITMNYLELNSTLFIE